MQLFVVLIVIQRRLSLCAIKILACLVKIYERPSPNGAHSERVTRRITMRHGNRCCRSRQARGLLVMRLTTERPVGDILPYRSKTGCNDALKCNRTLVTIPSAYVHFCKQSMSRRYVQNSQCTSVMAFNAFQRRESSIPLYFIKILISNNNNNNVTYNMAHGSIPNPLIRIIYRYLRRIRGNLNFISSYFK